MAFKPIDISARTTPKRSFRIETFLGENLSDAPANVHPSFSPECPNFIRETGGKVRKWIGWHTVRRYPDRINGVHFLRGKDIQKLVHAGTCLYLEGTAAPQALSVKDAIYTGLADSRSTAKQIGDKLLLLDGCRVLLFDGKKVQPAQDVAYVPTVMIASTPKGGGTALEPVNLLSRWRKQTIIGDSTSKLYQLCTDNLDADPVEVTKTTASGDIQLVEGKDFTVERSLGQLTFTATHPPVTEGIPNLTVKLAATKEGYADKINKCDISTLYGLGGNRDRLFVSGNPDFPNYDWYSQRNDATYFGDLWYSVLGQDSSAIMGYSIVGELLAAHKDRSDDNTNIFLRKGDMLNGQAAFVSSGSYQGAGAVSKYAFASLCTEPMYLTREGIFAVTPSDVLGERYAQNRSYYLNGKLTAQPNLDNAVCAIYDQFYMLAVGGILYALDGLQFRAERNMPYSTRQYIGYHRTNVDARVLWQEGERLCFGTDDGCIREFYTNWGDQNSFNDDGQAIYAKWTTPPIEGANFYKNKKFRNVALMVASAVATGARVWALLGGQRELVMDYNSSARYFSYGGVIYSKFNYKTDSTPQELKERFKTSKVTKASFVFENDVLNEPCGLYEATIEFTESR